MSSQYGLISNNSSILNPHSAICTPHCFCRLVAIMLNPSGEVFPGCFRSNAYVRQEDYLLLVFLTPNSAICAPHWQFGEKVIFLRLLKNAQMQVESAKSRLRGRPRAFHLPFRQAILRVASRRIRSDFLPRRRVGESARGVLERTPQ
mgnify:CR=1 FL=1